MSLFGALFFLICKGCLDILSFCVDYLIIFELAWVRLTKDNKDFGYLINSLIKSKLIKQVLPSEGLADPIN